VLLSQAPDLAVTETMTASPLAPAEAKTFHCRNGKSGVMVRALWLAVLLVASAHAADDAEWRMPATDYAATRYSPLADITTTNVREPKEAWNFTTGVQAGHEAAPLVAGGLIYVVTPYPNQPAVTPMAVTAWARP
jgi:glucose dehydrogenase